MSILTKIRTIYGGLSKTHKRIADIILSRPNEVITMSITEVAALAKTSETTVMRFLREIGFDSYQFFKVSLAQEIVNRSAKAFYEDIDEKDSISLIKKKIISSTIVAIEDLDHLLQDSALEQVVNLMKEANRIIFAGVGASGAIAMDAFHKFIRLGLNSVLSSDSHIFSILCANSTKSDVIFAISHSGESREIIDAIEFAKNNGSKIVSMTSYPNSTLAKMSDFVLLSSTKETKYRSDAMTSRIVQCVIIDTLYVALALRLGPEAIEKVNLSRLAVAKKKK